MSSPDDEPAIEAALEAQQALLEDSLPLVFEVYNAAVAEQVDQPVVILLDCEDESVVRLHAAGWEIRWTMRSRHSRRN